jgi:hypothetical protein
VSSEKGGSGGYVFGPKRKPSLLSQLLGFILHIACYFLSSFVEGKLGLVKA